MNNSTITLIIVVALILFAIFRRARALFTRQKINQHSLMFRMGVFVVLGVVVAIASLLDPVSLLGDLIGLAAGAVVAYFGLRLTVFEQEPDGLYYKPNVYISAGVFVLFIARYGYRIIESFGEIQTIQQQAKSGGGLANIASQFSSDPITSAAYFLMIGYYVFYYVMLIMRSRQTVVTS